MVAHNVLFNIIEESGYCDDYVEDHSFLISPDVYILSPSDQNQINNIGIFMPTVLHGADRLMNEVSPAHKINAIINSGIPQVYQRIQREHLQIPEIVKVDLIKDVDGRFWIMEVDSINKHGWGLTMLINKLRDIIMPNAHVPQSIAKILGQAILESGFYNNAVSLISASHEHFYLPEFKILSRELSVLGVSMIILEEPISANDVRTLSIDFPFLFRSSKEEATDIAKAYCSFKKGFLLPPKPFLGSKAIMSLVINREEQNEVQEIVRTYISDYALAGLSRYIPPTFLVNKRKGSGCPYWLEYAQGNRCVLKACLSSGARQVYFPESGDYWNMVQKACSSNSMYVLQHEIISKLHRIRYFNHSGDVVEEDMYCRFTAYFSLNALVDLRVVARSNKRVHGSPDAVQMGVVIG